MCVCACAHVCVCVCVCVCACTHNIPIYVDCGGRNLELEVTKFCQNVYLSCFLNNVLFIECMLSAVVKPRKMNKIISNFGGH